MATAEALISVLAQRVRDPQYTATSKDQWLVLLSRAEAMWNAATLRIIAEGSITLEPHCVVYPVQPWLPDCVRIVSVRAATHTLWPVDAKTLRTSDPAWLRSVAGRPEQWSMIGRDLLIIHPAVEAATTLTVAYVQHTPVLTTLDQELVMPEHEHPGLLDIAEALAALRLRQFKLLAAAGERLKARMGGS